MPAFRIEPPTHLDEVACDTETTGLNRWTGSRPFMIQFFFKRTQELIIYEWDVNPFTRVPIIPRRDLREVRDIVLDPKLRKLFFNCKFDIFMLEAIGIANIPLRDAKGYRLIEEVSWMARACNNLEFSYGLKNLSKRYLDIDDTDEKELDDTVKASRGIAKKLGWNIAVKEKADDKPHKRDFWIPRALEKHHPELLTAKIDPDACARYGGMDVERTLALYEMYEEGMNEYDIWESYDREMRVLPITMQMERDGIRIDVERMKMVANHCTQRAKDALFKLVRATKNPAFNPNSSAHVQDMLFNGKPLKLESFKNTKNGNASTDSEALEPHMSEPLVRLLLTYKANTKAKNTFFDKYEKLMTPNERVHPGYNQLGTLTWRYSCTEPNLQQVSSPESSNSRAREFLVDIRQVFIPDSPNHVMIAPDYKQMEVIIFAAIYKVGTMLSAIKAGQHIHKATADKIYGGQNNDHAINAAIDVMQSTNFGWPEHGSSIERVAEKLLAQHNWSIISLEESLGEESYKKRAKSATFTKIFGGGWRALMSWLPGISANEAKNILSLYDKAFPDMAEAMAEIEHRGRMDGYIITPYGVRLAVDRWYAYRIINHVIQSSAASQMKLGMLKCQQYIIENNLQDVIRIAMTVHDELIFMFKKDWVYKKILKKLGALMGDHEGRFDIELPVDIDILRERWSMKEPVKL